MEQAERDLLLKISTVQELMQEDVKHIKEWVEETPCQRHNEKIKFTERVAWTAILAAIGAITKAFWK